ncbi:MAG: HAMP domain-containing sensor histidine kinase [Rhodospirillaceae bacterium]|nr:HAMP domain-containing sensor histidine kinase [Rhodospirillaceae bacterium]
MRIQDVNNSWADMAKWHALGWGPDTSPATAVELNIERLLAMARQQPVAAATHSLNSLLLAVLYWPTAPHAHLIGFQILFQAAAAWQLWTWWRHRRSPRPLTVSDRTITRATLWAVAFGALWGTYGALMLVAPGGDDVRMLVGFVLAGMAGGGAFVLFSIPAALTGYLVMIAGPPLIVFATWSWPNGPLLVAYTVIYVAALLASGHNAHRILVESIRLRLQNIDLAVKADAASRAKSRFLANMSHELRTPLNAIVGFAEMIHSQFKGPVGNPQYLEFAQAIHTSGRHLVAIIDDILDLSKIESGQVDLELEPTAAHAVVDQAMLLSRNAPGGAQLTISATVAADAPSLHVDPRRLTQALVNLLSNAIKFTPAGGCVSVEVKRAADGGEVITVSETAIGIAAGELAEVLKPFVQSREAERQRTPGTGLGLPLAEQLVKLHGGRLTLSSSVGEGTTATIYLPPARTLANDTRRATC